MGLLDAVPSMLLGSAFGDVQVTMDVLSGGADAGSTFVDGVVRENWVFTGTTLSGVLKRLSEEERASGDDETTHHFRALGTPVANTNDYLRQSPGAAVFRVASVTDALGIGALSIYRLVEQVGMVA